jgi:hypothetical protein
MAQPLIVTLPPNLDLWPGCIIRVTAVDPATGSTVAGIRVSNISIEGVSDDGAALAYGPFMLVTGPSG